MFFSALEKTSFVSINCISEREGDGPGHWFGMRIAELSIYLPSRSAFWRIQFDWLPSDCKRAVSCEMDQDFGANARVPPKSAPGRLENASSAVSIPNQYPGPSPSLSVHYLHLQSVINQQNPNIMHLIGHYKTFAVVLVFHCIISRNIAPAIYTTAAPAKLVVGSTTPSLR